MNVAKVQIEGVIDHLSSEMRRALEIAVQETIPGARFDPHQLFRAFRGAVGRTCNVWEAVPDNFVAP
jgi:hypothetical protein